MHKALALWIYIGSIYGIIAANYLTIKIFSVYPTDHYRSFGPNFSAASKAYVELLLPNITLALAIYVLCSFFVVVYIWRINKATDVRCFYIALTAGINYFLAMFIVMFLVTNVFLIPKLSNGI